jgi:hypothetical protein
MMNPKTIFLPRLLVQVMLASVFGLGFLLTPYWNHVPTKTDVLPVLVLTITVGTLWSVISAGELRINAGPIHWGYFLCLLAGLIILNIRPISASIPWRGDEDVHIARTVELVQRIPFKWVFPFLVLFVLLAYLAWKRSKWAILPGIALLAGMIVFNIIINPLADISSSLLLRYPYISYWLFALLPKLALAGRLDPYQEVLFRVVPFLSTLALAWFFQNSLSGSKPFLKFLWGLAAATVPLVYFYSSSLYLELPAVFLMLVVCINIKGLLQEDFPTIRQDPAWLALILIGFVKETTTPFLVCFLGWRLLSVLLRAHVSPEPTKLRLRRLLGEAGIALSVLLPILLFLFLRSSLSDQSRGYDFTPSNLFNPLVYRTIARAFLQQFGVPLLLLFAGGCLLLVLKKEYIQVGFLLSVVCLYPLFHASDVLAYTGFSRFDLFVLPAVLAGAGVLIKRALIHRNILGGAVVAAVLVINLCLSPILFDGTRKPAWGIYMINTTARTYPYREALSWLKTGHADDRILFSGMYYPYRFDFYFDQLNWTPTYEVLLTNQPDSDSVSLGRALAEAKKGKFNLVLFQVMGHTPPQVGEMGAFSEKKIFKNEAYLLILYERIPPG